MNVSINFPTQIESELLQLAAAAGMDVEKFVQEVVAERIAEAKSQQTGSASHDEFRSKLRTIVSLHPASRGFVDDSRESIYAGRGE